MGEEVLTIHYFQAYDLIDEVILRKGTSLIRIDEHGSRSNFLQFAIK